MNSRTGIVVDSSAARRKADLTRRIYIPLGSRSELPPAFRHQPRHCLDSTCQLSWSQEKVCSADSQRSIPYCAYLTNLVELLSQSYYELSQGVKGYKSSRSSSSLAPNDRLSAVAWISLQWIYLVNNLRKVKTYRVHTQKSINPKMLKCMKLLLLPLLVQTVSVAPYLESLEHITR